MANGPVPARVGHSKREEAKKAAQAVATITLRGDSWKLNIGSIPIGEKRAVRVQAGAPFEQFFAGEQQIGEDSVCVLWWLARRADGEPFLTLTEAEAEWPTDLQEDEISMTVDLPEDGDDHPEA